MPLNDLTLAITQGVQGRPFRSKINGATAGTDIDVEVTGAPGFSVANGFLRHQSLPAGYLPLVAALVERNPLTGETRRTRLTITAASRAEIVALAAGAPKFRTVGTGTANGLEWTLRTETAAGAAASLTIGLPPPDTTAPTITSTASHNVLENTPYAAVATANEPVTWAKGGTDAALVTLNPATGAWSVAAQDYETRTSVVFTLTATDLAGNASAAQTVTLTIGDVADGPAMTLSGALADPVYAVGYDQTLTRTNGTGPFTLAVASGALPEGLTTWVDATGAPRVSGVPTGAAGTFNFTLRLTDVANGATADLARTITIPVLPASLAINFGALTRIGYGGHPLGYRGTGRMAITAGDAAGHWRVSADNMLVPRNGATLTYGNNPPVYAGPYTLTVTEYTDATLSVATGLVCSVGVTMIAGRADIRSVPSTIDANTTADANDAFGTTANHQIAHMLASTTRIRLGETISIRNCRWTTSTRFRPQGAYQVSSVTPGTRITIRSQFVDQSIGADGIPNRRHGGIMRVNSCDSATSGNIHVPIDWRDVQSEITQAQPATGSPNLYSYNAAGYGMCAYNIGLFTTANLDPGYLDTTANGFYSRGGLTADTKTIVDGVTADGLNNVLISDDGEYEVKNVAVRRNRSDTFKGTAGSERGLIQDVFVGAFFPDPGQSGGGSGDHADIFQHSGVSTGIGQAATIKRLISYPKLSIAAKSSQGVFIADTVDPGRIEGVDLENLLMICNYVNGIALTRCNGAVVQRCLALAMPTSGNNSFLAVNGAGTDITIRDSIFNGMSGLGNISGTVINENNIVLSKANYGTVFPYWNPAAEIVNAVQAMNAFRPELGRPVAEGGLMKPDGRYIGPLFPNGTWNDGTVYVS
jgi:hypothetical protein